MREWMGQVTQSSMQSISILFTCDMSLYCYYKLPALSGKREDGKMAKSQPSFMDS